MIVKNNINRFMDHYAYMRKTFESLFGYKLFFIGGNLLGYIREGDVLSHDRDMDVAYFSNHERTDKVVDEYISIIKRLYEHGEQLSVVTKNGGVRKHYAWWEMKGQGHIDLMPMWHENGRLYRSTFVGFDGNKSVVLPLKKRTFYNTEIYIPNKPKVQLEGVYGKNWRVPKKKFIKKKDNDTRKKFKAFNRIKSTLKSLHEKYNKS